MNIFTCKLTELPKISCIYKITCTENNRFYIGSAISFRKRVKDHRNNLLRKEHSSYKLQNDFNKLGKEKFEIEIIVNFNQIIEFKSDDYKEILLKTEEEYIQKLHPYYNVQQFPYSSFGNFSSGIKIYQYDLEGNFIKEWNSSAEVERTLGFNPENGLRKQSAGKFQWSREKVDKMPKYKSNSGCKSKRMCSLYDLWGNKLQTFESYSDLAIYLWGEANDKYRNKIWNYCNTSKAITNQYRVGNGDDIKLDNTINRKHDKYFILIQYDLNNNIVNIWATLAEFIRQTNLKPKKEIINGEECYITENYILKRL